MILVDTMPDYIQSALNANGIPFDEIKLTASADLSLQYRFCEIWLAFTETKLVVVEGIVAEEIRPGLLKRKSTFPSWSTKQVYEYSLHDIEEFSLEQQIANGIFIAKVKGENKIVCFFSNHNQKKFGVLTKLANSLLKNKQLEMPDEELHSMVCPVCKLRYPDVDRRVCPKCIDRKAVFIRVLSFILRYKYKIILILLCIFASSGLNLVTPYLGGHILFDEVLAKGGRYYGKIPEIILLIIFSRLASLGIIVVHWRINAFVASEVVFDIKTNIFNAIQHMSFDFLNRNQTGRLIANINNDTSNIQQFFHFGFPFFILNLVSIVSISVSMVLIDWKLAILVLIPTPLIMLILSRTSKKLQELSTKRFNGRSKMYSLINNTLKGIRVIKVFGKEQYESLRFSGISENSSRLETNYFKTVKTVFPIVHFIMGFGGLIIWGYGGWRVLNGDISIGTLITFIGYVSMIYGPLEFMNGIIDWWTSCMNSAQRVFEVIDTMPEKKDANYAGIKDIEGLIEFRDVNFSYNPNKKTLKNINMKIMPGEMVGIIGHTGAGKSTIANLITGLYDVREGVILIDDIDIRDIPTKKLRRQVGMVMQETFLFSGTIAQNIAYAKPDASMEEIIKSAKAANAHDFITRMPNGYDTVIGAGGNNLSGGERQRISIARTVLQNPRILILDEATASMDTETEWQIQQALERLMKGRTTIYIAHRISTIRNADKIIVMENGSIIEMGAHMELVKKDGVYFNLLKLQSSALKLKGVGVCVN